MIFYFSSTGNCKYVVDQIKGEDELIVRMDTALNENNLSFDINNERVGIVTPTYCWGTPSITSEFLSKVSFIFKSKPYIFFIATYGTTTGANGQLVNNILKSKNLCIDAFFDIKMPDNWTPVFDLSDKIKVEKKIAIANKHIIETKELIESEREGDYRDNKAPLVTGKIGMFTYDNIYRKTSNLSVTDACIGCGLCEKKCPVDAIEMKEGKPIWIKEKCAMCLGCLHRCPKFAIQYGKNTKKHGQYIHPEVKIKDL